MVPQPRAALLAARRPRERLLQQPLHRADPARRDPEPLLGEPGALQVVGAAERPEHRVRPDLDVEAQRRVPVRVGVRERRVLDDRDARPRRSGTRNSVGPSGATATTMITSATSPLVTNHFSPRIRQPPPGERLGGRLDPRRVRAGERLGHRVGVLRLAAQHRPQPAVDLLLGPGRPDVVGVRHVPGERVGRAAELLLDQRPGRCATSPGRRARRACSPPVEPGLERRPRGSPRPPRPGSRPPARSAACSRGISCSSTKRRARSAIASRRPCPAPAVVGHRLRSPALAPGSPSASASWLATTSRTSAARRGRSSGGIAPASAALSRSHASQRPAARAARAARRRARSAASSAGGRRRATAAQHRARLGQQPLGLGRQRQPAVVAAAALTATISCD